MTRMTGPDCVVMCNLINTYIQTYIHTYIHTYILLVAMATYSTDGFAPSDSIVANPEVSWKGE